MLPQPVYGFASRDHLKFRRAVGHKDLFYFDDKDVDFKDVSNSQSYTLHTEITFTCFTCRILYLGLTVVV